MKRRLLVISILGLTLLAAVAGIVNYFEWSEERFVVESRQAKHHVAEVTDWFIAHGLEMYSGGQGVGALNRKLETFGVSKGSDFTFDTGSLPIYASLFVRGGKGYTAKLNCMARTFDADGRVYEYWFRRYGNRGDWTTEFIFTEADSVSSSRTVVHRTRKFIPSHTFAGGIEIHYPMDLNAIAPLFPSLYPEAFSGTVLENKIVITDEDGERVIMDYDEFRRMRKADKK